MVLSLWVSWFWGGPLSSIGMAIPFGLTAIGMSGIVAFRNRANSYEHWSGSVMEEVMEAIDEALAGQEDVDWELFVVPRQWPRR